jgi:hypothetical protein
MFDKFPSHTRSFGEDCLQPRLEALFGWKG